MLLYASLAHKEIRKFGEHSEALRRKFEKAEDADDLLLDVKSLRARFQELRKMLPEKVRDAGSLGRHIGFMVYWLEKDKVDSCSNDIVQICDHDIPSLEDGFIAWCGSETNIDKELGDAVGNLVAQLELDSAIRKSFVILKDRLCKASGAPLELDGEELVNAIFGNGAIHPIRGLSDSQRQAFRNLLAGLFGAFRNPFAHTDREPTWPETDAVISMVSYLLSEFGKWQRPADSDTGG